MREVGTAETFSFRPRPLPVPGDLRIGWRLAVIVLMLGKSRAKSASLAKLHILNDLLRTKRSTLQLDELIAGNTLFSVWPVRVEPAFGRAIDFAVGEGLIEWTQLAQRSGLKLTEAGIASWKAISAESDVLCDEKNFIAAYAGQLTEGAVSSILRFDQRSL